MTTGNTARPDGPAIADVVVIGAGAAGLACARRLRQDGLSVVVHEARERIGGRIHTFHPADGGPPLELGAQVVHGDRNPVHALIGAARMTAVPRRVTARIVLDGADQDMGVLAHHRRAPWLLEAQLQAGPGPDGLSAAGWLALRRSTGAERRAAEEWFRQNWAAEPDELSAPGIAAAHRADTAGEGEFAVRGGFDRLPLLLAEGLDVRLGDPVRGLHCGPGLVEARTGRGGTAARAAVLTVPPPVLASGRLAITGLPAEALAAKLAAAAELPLGDGYCLVVTLDRAAPDTVISFDVDGAGGFVRCASGRPEVLFVAKAGAAAALRAAVADRPALAVLLATVLPWTAGAAVTGLSAADWGQDPYTGGAFTAPRTGCADAAARWAAPVADTLFFAGEATMSGSRLPWVHGALESGERAAGELLRVLANR
ncbi:flavin monoamine oxidase family protein [Kitasatospora sp. NPDC050543]|uniref:flavin monoamine oxidase family protein n=1 Tax=Kitasatospora sp. NPDC050543 TaxID=3364054 RepID=UPI0037A8E8DF